jgi:adenylate cyclase
MTDIDLFRVKSTMILGNFVSNVIGVCVALFLGYRVDPVRSPEVALLGQHINMVFIPCAFLLVFFLTLAYERPIRHYLGVTRRGGALEQNGMVKVHRRILNEPFFLVALDFGVWLAAATLYAGAFWASGASTSSIHSTFFTNLYTGLITTTVAFFVSEHHLQRRLIPYFFPNGGVYMIPGTLRIRIRTRLTALLFACNLVPFVAILNSALGAVHTHLEPGSLLDTLRSELFANSLIFIGVGIWLTLLVGSNLTRPFEEIIRVLKDVRQGNFNNRVRVTSNDEIGYAGDVINEMNEGLKERDLIKETFGRYVSQEIRDEVLSGKIPLDGEKKHVTILFSDLREFIPLTESNDPKLVVKIMNNYFKEMSEAIRDHGGLVLQFIGDEIYAVFGAPISQPEHPERAFRAGLEMNRRLDDLNKQFEEKGWPRLKHGIGIHTGEALAANIGSPDRLSYLLIGDTVNLASRLQSLTKELGTRMIISAATHTHLTDSELGATTLKKMPGVQVKGMKLPVEVFALA